LQDALVVSALGNGGVLAVVADGAGSAKFGAIGARRICRFLFVRIHEWLRHHDELPPDDQIRHWLEKLRVGISQAAARRGTASRQFAATLVAIIIGPNEAITLQIGDSAIVGRKDGRWQVLCWPDTGEFASSTFFVTDEPEPNLTIVRHPREHDAFALFSDGVGEIALSHLQSAAYPQFFDPMIHPVDCAHGAGYLVDLSERLAAFLASAPVCERTEDDKTIILISGK
jgi:hypothetical protein